MHLLISSYLDGRKQFVSFGGYESNCEKIAVRVPQGSVLGPLLFLIHINDLQNNTSLRVLNFADDTMLYKTFTKTTYLNDGKGSKLHGGTKLHGVKFARRDKNARVTKLHGESNLHG